MADETEPEPGWLPYRACLGGLETLIRMLFEDREMFKAEHAALDREINKLRAENEALRAENERLGYWDRAADE